MIYNEADNAFKVRDKKHTHSAGQNSVPIICDVSLFIDIALIGQCDCISWER